MHLQIQDTAAGNIVLFKHNNFFTDRGRTGTRTVKSHDCLILQHSLYYLQKYLVPKRMRNF